MICNSISIAHARDNGVNIQATWMGDGILMDEMKALIAKLGLNSSIELTGFEQNRDTLLHKIRESQTIDSIDSNKKVEMLLSTLC